MPIYQYHCDSCGEFSELRPLSESALAQPCPECGHAASRIISATRLGIMDASNRMRWERNERSQNAPRQARRSSCGCTGTHTCNTGKTNSGKTKTEEAPQAPPLMRQTKRTARPWMLGH